MQTISAKQQIVQKQDQYFQRFISKNGDEYGLRFGTPQDANVISRIFKEVYDYNYAYPLIYDINHLKKELAKKTNFWFVGELIENREIAGAGLLEKKRYIAHAGRAVVKKKFQGKGITTKIGAAGIITVTKMPQFKDVLRLDTEARGLEVKAQKLIEKAGAIPFGAIPAYINWGDKRSFKIVDNKPIPPIQEEASIFYSIIFKKLWNLRENEVHLLNNEDIIFFYKYIKAISRKMKDDILILEDGYDCNNREVYGVSKDYYEGRINLYGYIEEKSLNHLLKTYKNWRLIIWRIPTTKKGISSMSLAIDKGFKSVGYDIGFYNENWTLFDSIIFVFHPSGFPSLDIKCLNEAKPLINKIKELYSS